MSKRNPEDVLAEIEAWNDDGKQGVDEAAVDAEMERVLAMTPKQRERELRQAGIDVEAERAKADALLRRLKGEDEGQGGKPPARLPPPKRARFPLQPLMFLAAAAALAVAIGTLRTPENVTAPLPERSIDQVRQEAIRACTAKDRETCAKLLDELGGLDPKEAEKIRWLAPRSLGGDAGW